MRKVLLLVAIVLVAVSVSAQMRMHPSTPPASPSVGTPMGPGGIMPGGLMPAAMVSGKVETVSGSLITLASSTITIDASVAKIVGDGGAAATVATIKPGDIVFATLKTADILPNAPLPATAIVISRPSDVTLVGDVQSIDATAKSFNVLGRTIYTDANTSYGGMGSIGGMTPGSGMGPGGMGPVSGAAGFADLKVDSDVSVQARVVSGKIVATSVMIMGPVQTQTTFLRGTVKSIAADRWVITTTNDVTVLVNTQTKIVGAPKVGDKVDVMATTDSAKNYVALAIMKSIF